MNIKLVKASIIFLICVLSTNLFAEENRVTVNNAPFLYESRAEIKTPDHIMAEYVSEDYKYADDEFTKHDLFQQIKPVMKKHMEKAIKTKSVSLLIAFDLKDYDFDKGAFATGFSENSIIPFDNGYAVTFTNGSKIKYLPVAMEKARSLAPALRNSRASTMKIHGKIIDVSEGYIAIRVNKSINIQITKIEVELESEEKVGELKL